MIEAITECGIMPTHRTQGNKPNVFIRLLRTMRREHEKAPQTYSHLPRLDVHHPNHKVAVRAYLRRLRGYLKKVRDIPPRYLPYALRLAFLERMVNYAGSTLLARRLPANAGRIISKLTEGDKEILRPLAVELFREELLEASPNIRDLAVKLDRLEQALERPSAHLYKTSVRRAAVHFTNIIMQRFIKMNFERKSIIISVSHALIQEFRNAILVEFGNYCNSLIARAQKHGNP